MLKRRPRSLWKVRSPETEGTHHGEGPVQPGEPAVLRPLVEHDRVETDREDRNGDREYAEIGEQAAQVLANLALAEDRHELRDQELHRAANVPDEAEQANSRRGELETPARAWKPRACDSRIDTPGRQEVVVREAGRAHLVVETPAPSRARASERRPRRGTSCCSPSPRRCPSSLLAAAAWNASVASSASGTSAFPFSARAVFDAVEDVARLRFGDVDQRDVPDRAVRSDDHEEVREAGHRDRAVGARFPAPRPPSGSGRPSPRPRRLPTRAGGSRWRARARRARGAAVLRHDTAGLDVVDRLDHEVDVLLLERRVEVESTGSAACSRARSPA